MRRQCDLDTLSGRRVLVYKNLHQNCFSVMLRDTRRVVLHTDSLLLADVRFLVSRAGRERAIREARRNVHAFVEGTFNRELNAMAPQVRRNHPREVTYNPFVATTFRFRDTGEPVVAATYALCIDGRAYINTQDVERMV